MIDNPDIEALAIGSAVDECRERLDELDTTLIAVVGERMELCAKIAELKHLGQIPMMQPDRLQHVRKKSVGEGRLQGLDENFVHRLIDVITEESCRLEDEIIDRLGLHRTESPKSDRGGPPARRPK